MKALSLDTATDVLSVCAMKDSTWASLAVRQGLQHSPTLLPMAQRLLADLGMNVGELDLVVCTIGPGSFTGIRIGISTALGIGKGGGIPVVGVSTLDAMARAWSGCPVDVFPVIDARRGNVYTACFRDGARQGDYRDVSPSELAVMLEEARSPILVGPDAPEVARLLGSQGTDARVSETADPRMVLELGIEVLRNRGAEAAFPRPLYLRKSEAERVSGR